MHDGRKEEICGREKKKLITDKKGSHLKRKRNPSWREKPLVRRRRSFTVDKFLSSPREVDRSLQSIYLILRRETCFACEKKKENSWGSYICCWNFGWSVAKWHWIQNFCFERSKRKTEEIATEWCIGACKDRHIIIRVMIHTFIFFMHLTNTSFFIFFSISSCVKSYSSIILLLYSSTGQCACVLSFYFYYFLSERTRCLIRQHTSLFLPL